MNKVRTIIEKEWAEVFKNRMVLFTVAFMPLLLTALPLVTLAFTGGFEEELSSAGGTPDEFFGDLCTGLTELECTQVYTLNLFTLLFMMIPMIIPVTIAAYSIVGEKATKSLEPLLATPITTTQIVIGKTLAAVVPAVIASWLAFVIYLIGARLMVNNTVFTHLINPLWMLAIFGVGPLLALFSVNVAIMVSSRVSDPRIAEQLAGVVVLPIIALVVGQSVGAIIVNQQMILVFGLVAIILDAITLYLSIQIFERETILTRWK